MLYPRAYSRCVGLALLLMSYALVGSLSAQSQPQRLPLRVPADQVQPLSSLHDPWLQGALSDRMNQHESWGQLIRAGKMSVGLVDLSDPSRPRFAEINGNEMMYAASLPKIAILLAAVDALDKGELPETPEVQADLQRMISKSDNMAATRMIDLLGYEKIESVLTDPRYQLYNPQAGGGLWVGKRYASQGRRYPDPLKGLSHAATAEQVCRFYYLMAMGQLVSYERSQQMLRIMVDPALHHKFVNTLDEVAPRAKVFRKSGTWRNYHADSVLVWGPKRRYILVGLVEAEQGEAIMRELVREVEVALGLGL